MTDEKSEDSEGFFEFGLAHGGRTNLWDWHSPEHFFWSDLTTFKRMSKNMGMFFKNSDLLLIRIWW